MKINRVVLIVLDSVGIGALPDASDIDINSNTLGNIAIQYPGLKIPNLIKMGMGNIDPSNQLDKIQFPTSSYGKAAEKSSGKDTTTGHWEICGVTLDKAFPTFPKGFPQEFISRFEKEIGVKTIWNKTASGTAIINQLGNEHMRTKRPIVYTSADSVFQIAMHENIYPIAEQYKICQIARNMLVGEYAVGRVIARPFIGTDGNFIRTSNRKDFSLIPPDNLLDAIIASGQEVISIGKIADIFAGKGISHSMKTANNQEGTIETIKAIQADSKGLIFTNLVDFDMLYGHRRDVVGYARALMDFDKELPTILSALKNDDILIITADHGNDPTASGTDHTREYIPILTYGNMIKEGVSIGIRNSFADISATISDALHLDFQSQGTSYFPLIVE